MGGIVVDPWSSSAAAVIATTKLRFLRERHATKAIKTISLSSCSQEDSNTHKLFSVPSRVH